MKNQQNNHQSPVQTPTISQEEKLKMADKYYLQGKEAYENYVLQAAKYFKQCIDIYPKHVKALNALAEIYMLENNIAQAERLLNSALAFSNTLEERILSLDNLADLYDDTGQYELALFRFLDLLELKKEQENPEELSYFYNKVGECYTQLKKWEEAKYYYETAFQLEPEAYFLVRLSDVCRENKNFEEALALFQQAISLLNAERSPDKDNNLRSAYFGLGQIYFEQKNLKAAKKWFDKAERLLIGEGHVLTYKAAIEAYNGSISRMEQYLQVAIDDFEDHPEDLATFFNRVIENEYYYKNEKVKKSMLSLLYDNELLQKKEYELRCVHKGKFEISEQQRLQVIKLIKSGKAEKAIALLVELTLMVSRDKHQRACHLAGLYHTLKLYRKHGTVAPNKAQDEMIFILGEVLGIVG